jgi:hypothetical protein
MKLAPAFTSPRGKGGRREDLNNIYFRSRWEANWARYLNFLIRQGQIRSWEFEPDTFEFIGIRRGGRFYTPDFKIINNDGSIEYHEVKGWMTGQGATKIKRMRRYHPRVKLLLVDRSQYRSVASTLSRVIPGWETSPSHGRIG